MTADILPEPQVVTLNEILDGFEADKSLDRALRGITTITASALSACERRVVLRALNHAPTDSPPTVTVATIGSLLHEAYTVLMESYGYEVVTGPHGTCDALRRDLKVVRDLKTVTRSRYDRWAAQGIPDGVWQQVHEYAFDHGADQGGWTVVIDVLDRDTGRAATITRPWDEAVHAEAARRLARMNTDVDDHQIPPIPEERHGHSDPACQSCEFLTYCWGDTNVSLLFDDEQVEHWGTEWLAAAQAEADARKVKARLRVRLSNVDGVFGNIKVSHRTVGGYTKEVTRADSVQTIVERAT